MAGQPVPAEVGRYRRGLRVAAARARARTKKR
jgi:hypothetical protein